MVWVWSLTRKAFHISTRPVWDCHRTADLGWSVICRPRQAPLAPPLACSVNIPVPLVVSGSYSRWVRTVRLCQESRYPRFSGSYETGHLYTLGLQPYPQKVVRPPKPTPTIFSGGGWSPREPLLGCHVSIGTVPNSVLPTGPSARAARSRQVRTGSNDENKRR